MKTLIIGDLHLNGNDPLYLESQHDFFNEIAEIECDRIVFLGDIFHFRTPKVLELLVFNEILSKLVAFNEDDYGQPIRHAIVLAGNHDYFDREYKKSVLTLFANYGRVGVVTNDSNEPDIFSYTEDIVELKRKLNECNVSTIYGHFGYNGLLSPEGFDENGLTLKDFSKFKRVFLGHIHHHAINDNVCIVGTPYTTSFSEAGKTSYVALLTEDDYSFDAEYVMIPTKTGPRHHILDEANLDITALSKDNYNIVKVISDSMEFSKIRKKIPDFVTNITLEPRVAKIGHDNYWTGTTSMLSSYLENTNTDLDKKKLTKLLKEIQNEQSRND
jgi:DNA repair exonuclease SbcCD nuclease subunit